MMDPVEDQQRAPEQQMVALRSGDWEIDLSPGLMHQLLDLTPYINSSAFKVSETQLCGLHATQAVHVDCV